MKLSIVLAAALLLIASVGGAAYGILDGHAVRRVEFFCRHFHFSRFARCWRQPYHGVTGLCVGE